MPPPLPGPFEHLAPLLTSYGYWAVGGVVLVEDFGVPAPGETILIAAGVYAGAGELNVVAVGLIGFLAAVLGDNLGYLIGRVGGRAFVHRWGRYVFLTPERFERAERFFLRHGGKIVTVARFVEGLRQANGIIAGTTGMHWLRFLAFNALGAALWVGLWVTLAYVAGSHIDTVYAAVEHYEKYVLAALGVVVAALITRHVVRRRRRRRS
ncbi:DedA family protein [Streptomyces thermoviolaceus]|jgi:membrane protein DedA with SNARE-associated domain|uniref:DedA family protein n=1 Tax=Streptomyces thermoviolaceus subsp. thermoviolaceus TaxID=66860 RepID=A0ABX0YRU7_STRTL|nr:MULTISPECIES: DedA family protein [Streptomyces]MCM3262747.1 DedA family protein [Streptomyces thermoviolaceus]NJP14823.1 DedA family protein [Streptomyces thermoviolaceus subsp. thermoviolaceus]RSS01246.1 DedA family protein [Streptomyces sp. WAC00469]WTD50198.1 DedA family protein [Streptomyces thermoviolaceus]GGV64595.1 DedA family protein [Streptomyces thermoviolaceus subsp. apingens]